MCLRAVVPNLPVVSLRLIRKLWHFWNPALQTLAMVPRQEGLLFLDPLFALIAKPRYTGRMWHRDREVKNTAHGPELPSSP